MPYYNLRRVNDQKTFTARRVSDASALFYFSILVGENLHSTVRARLPTC